MKKNLLFVFVLLLSGLSLAAQGRRAVTLSTEELPKRPIDTVATADPETFLILYSNNTFRYYRPALSRKLDELPVYRQHWDTTQIFAYKSIPYDDLPPIVELNLVSSLSEYKVPITGKVFSKYGPRRRRAHNGVDIPLKIGDPIFSAFEGKVRYSKFNTGGYGNLVILRHPSGLETWYAHLNQSNVQEDDYVKCGQVIGYGGNTGRSRGPHLHFELRYQDQTFDPEFLIDFETGNLKYQTFALEKSFFNIHSRASEVLDEEDESLEMPLLADAADGETSSQDILERIAAAQEKEKKKPADAPAGGAIYHTIKSGDMLGKLAGRYGVSIDQICRLNGITRTTILQLGRRLRIK